MPCHCRPPTQWGLQCTHVILCEWTHCSLHVRVNYVFFFIQITMRTIQLPDVDGYIKDTWHYMWQKLAEKAENTAHVILRNNNFKVLHTRRLAAFYQRNPALTLQTQSYEHKSDSMFRNTFTWYEQLLIHYTPLLSIVTQQHLAKASNVACLWVILH